VQKKLKIGVKKLKIGVKKFGGKGIPKRGPPKNGIFV